MKASKIIREIFITSLYVLVAVTLSFLVVKFVTQRTLVNGDSMNPHLSNGDHLMVDKISYRFSAPKRYDIIVFPYMNSETNFIKRIIGLPGETVLIADDGSIYINGELLPEGYGMEVMRDPGRAFEPVVLLEDEYFVLGDNRNDSSDSRVSSVGNIHKKDIIGKAWIRLLPLSEFGLIRHQ